MLQIDYEKLISRADIMYTKPVCQTYEGLPVGNGRMGTLVWTKPDHVGLQINRADVMPINRNHKGKQYGETDFCGFCASVKLYPGGEPFTSEHAFSQQLKVYDASVMLDTNTVHAEAWVHADQDCMMLKVCHKQEMNVPAYIEIASSRPLDFERGNFKATTTFVLSPGNGITLQQDFLEGDYKCSSAVAIGVSAPVVDIVHVSETVYRLVIDPLVQEYTVFISSADSFQKNTDVGQDALKLLNDAKQHKYADLKHEHEAWWIDFWQKSYVFASSADKTADFLERLHTYYLYLAAIISRGSLPPKFNGALWTTDGDKRVWGSQYWVWNMELLYFPLPGANHCELTENYFNMMIGRIEQCEKAAKWWWKSEGIYMPETTAFDGPIELEGELAQELQDITLRRKPAQFASDELIQATIYDSVAKSYFEPGNIDGYYYVSHILSCSSSIAMQTWWYYRITGDVNFLKEKAYPFLRGSVEFYRNYAKKGTDGIYHIFPTNVQESYWGAKDGIIDIAAIKGITPIALLVSEELGIDEELRPLWSEFLENIPAYPMGEDEEAQKLESSLGTGTWAGGSMGGVAGNRNSVQLWLMPVFPFEDVTLATTDQNLQDIASKTFKALPHVADLLGGKAIPVWSRLPVLTARMGEKGDFAWIPAAAFCNSRSLINGLDYSEGEQTQTAQMLASQATALQDALLQAVPGKPGGQEVIYLFAAWPDHWDGAFKLLSRGGFLIESCRLKGKIPFIAIHSNQGECLRINNPWPSDTVYVYRTDNKVDVCNGQVLMIDTSKGEDLILSDCVSNDIEAYCQKFSFDIPNAVNQVEVIMPNGRKVSKSIGN